MPTPRYRTSRQKVCHQCSKARAKCDRKATGCGRCSARRLLCSLHSTGSPPERRQEQLETPNSQAFDFEHDVSRQSDGRITSLGLGLGLPVNIQRNGSAMPSPPELSNAPPSSNPVRRPTYLGPNGAEITVHECASHGCLDFSGLELVCPIDADAICNRWLNAYVPLPGQTLKTYPANVTTFIYRTLKSYARKVVDSRGTPPFIHQSQMTISNSYSPLQTCLSLARIFGSPYADSQSVTGEILQQEMGRIHDRSNEFDQSTLLAGYQAYLLYAMIMYFFVESSNPFLRNSMLNLQDIAGLVCKSGIMCVAEQQHQHARPKWEAWILAEARRRTLYVMYLFDSLLSAQEGLPTFLGVELRSLPAPSSKQLWQATDRHDWERMYNLHLAACPSGGLRIDELWPAEEGVEDTKIRERQDRVDAWLQDVDEFGLMLYAVTCCTHGV